MSLSNYEIQKVLGKGAFGTVVKVKNKKNGLIYAMKRMKIDVEDIETSLNEIRLLYSLNHPNIISYKEAFYDKPTKSLNIVIEYAGDGDLSQKVKMNQKYHKRIDENTIWDWIIQLIIGIYYLHSSNCIHRDLKCANIFLKKNGLIKIGDLGVSKYLKNTLAYTYTGTPLYMAPEMLANLPYDFKVDIWSLGCIIYELCALELPFNGNNMVELSKNIKSGRYIPIPNIYSNDLKKIIALMLQINPKKRISSQELLNLPIINSKINKNYSKYKDLIEKLKKPEIIGTILPQEKILPKKKITNRNKCRNISKNKSKSKGKNPPISPKKKKVINKNKDIKDRSSSAKKNNLRNINPYYKNNTNQQYHDEYSERDYDNKKVQHNNYINEPSYYSKFTELKNLDEFSERDYDNKRVQYTNNVNEPSYYSKFTEQKNCNTRDYDNKRLQNNNYINEPSYYSKNNIETNYTNNNDINYNEQINKKKKFYNLLKDSFGPMKKASYYEYDEFRPMNNANLYNNYNNYNQIEAKKNYIMQPISKYDY